MGSKQRSQDFSPFEEYIDKRDIRNTFRLPRFEDPVMLDKHISPDWPPKFSSHDGYDHRFPVWGGYNKNAMGIKEYNDDDLGSDGSSEASGGSGGSGRSKFTRGPRIHHIPILVEARDDSSGYSSDTQTEETKPPQNRRAVPSDSTPYQGHSGHRKPPVAYQTPDYNQMAPNHSNYTPQQYGSYNAQTQRSKSDQHFGSSDRGHDLHPKKSLSQPPSSPPANERGPVQGPFLSKVRVNAPAHLVEGQSAVSAPSNVKVKKEKPNPKDQIRGILVEMNSLKDKVEDFQGTTKDKNYRYLDEMLTRLMLKLDDVDTDGQDDVRSERKHAVKEIQSCIALLEERLTQNESKARMQKQLENRKELEQDGEPYKDFSPSEHENGRQGTEQNVQSNKTLCDRGTGYQDNPNKNI